MNILIQLSHPAHFHLYKLVSKNLIDNGHNVHILIKSKDILETLLKDAQLPYYNINEVAHRKSKWGVLWDMLVRDLRILYFCRKNKIELLTGSTPEVAHIGKLLRIKSINTGEDDLQVVPMFEKIAGSFIKCFIAPNVCSGHSVESRTIHYPSYHELAYLHPNHFKPLKEKVEKCGIETDKPYFIMRFSSLNAHHDKGIKGINKEIAQRLVEILKPHGQIYITSERPLEPEFEPYRIKINPLDMHHVMAFASLYIGDSQTMAAEAGVLGTPFVRFNDFVGRIGYLDELEEKQSKQYVDYLNLDHHYDLGVGIRASEEGSVERLCQTVDRLASMPSEERKRIYGERRQRMLADKIDYAKFLTWFIENYPQSVDQAKKADEKFWNKFR